MIFFVYNITCTVLCLYLTVLYYTLLCCTALYYTLLYCTVLYYACTLLYFTLLYFTLLYFTVLTRSGAVLVNSSMVRLYLVQLFKPLRTSIDSSHGSGDGDSSSTDNTEKMLVSASASAAAIDAVKSGSGCIGINDYNRNLEQPKDIEVERDIESDTDPESKRDLGTDTTSLIVNHSLSSNSLHSSSSGSLDRFPCGLVKQVLRVLSSNFYNTSIILSS